MLSALLEILTRPQFWGGLMMAHVLVSATFCRIYFDTHHGIGSEPLPIYLLKSNLLAGVFFTFPLAVGIGLVVS